MRTDLVYFISDIHLGLDTNDNLSTDREQKLSTWLAEISTSAHEIYFMGDIFDYWFEYNDASLLQYPVFNKTLRVLRAKNVSIYFFTGNHDMWMKSYFKDEFGIEVIHNPIIKTLSQKQFYLAHGDGIGKGDYGYKLMKTIMRNPLSIFLYSLLPSKLGLRIMKFMSQRSRERQDGQFRGFSEERLVNFCNEHSQSNTIDFYIMGHRHLMIDYELSSNGPRYINLGDWLRYESYAVFDGDTLELKSLANLDEEIIIR